MYKNTFVYKRNLYIKVYKNLEGQKKIYIIYTNKRDIDKVDLNKTHYQKYNYNMFIWKMKEYERSMYLIT